MSVELRKASSYLFCGALVGALGLIPTWSQAVISPKSSEWELYDNFNKGKSPSKRKWSVSHNAIGGATVAIQKKKLTFTHAGAQPDGARSWAEFKIKPDKIIGVRVDIFTPKSCKGDIRGRLGFYIGGVPKTRDRIWAFAGVRPGRERLQYGAGRVKRSNGNWLGDYVWAQMPANAGSFVKGNTYTLEMTWNAQEMWVKFTGKNVALDGKKASAMGSYKFPKKLKKLKKSDMFIAIGSRSSEDGSGPCTVSFDNVHVLRSK